MIWGTDVTGTGIAGADWDAGSTGAWSGLGVVAGLGWVAVFGVARMSAPAGTLAAGTVAAVVCCWCATRVANTPTMATAIARRTSKNLSERAQKKCI